MASQIIDVITCFRHLSSNPILEYWREGGRPDSLITTINKSPPSTDIPITDCDLTTALVALNLKHVVGIDLTKSWSIPFKFVSGLPYALLLFPNAFVLIFGGNGFGLWLLIGWPLLCWFLALEFCVLGSCLSFFINPSFRIWPALWIITWILSLLASLSLSSVLMSALDPMSLVISRAFFYANGLTALITCIWLAANYFMMSLLVHILGLRRRNSGQSTFAVPALK